ncbi:MAG: T9SS type A sorting domain-containing protein [bacterium]
MKKVLILLVILSTYVYASGWKTAVSTNILIADNDKVEMYSNSFGNNIIKQTASGDLKYYLMNVSGTAGSAVTIDNSVTLANITGDDNNVYVLYKKNSVVKCKYSTDGGSTWTTKNDLNYNVTALDAIYKNNALHIAYTYNGTAKYHQFDGSYWTGQFDVSSTETGTSPRIEAANTADGMKIFIVYDNNDNCKLRALNLNTNQWDNVKTLFSSIGYSTPAGFGVDSLYTYLYYSVEIPPYYNDQLSRKIFRNSDNVLLNTYGYAYNTTSFLQTTTTADKRVHTLFHWLPIAELDGGVNHFSFLYNVETSETIYEDLNGYNFTNIDISSTFNDLHSLWREGSASVLAYRHYDINPSAPKNVALTNSSGHPRIQWSKNIDADINNYRVYRKYGTSAWAYLATTSSLYYVDASVYINTGGLAGTDVYYKITAKDLGTNESSYSSTVACNVNGQEIEKRGESVTVDEYNLLQNYPNPFNPSTTISYQLKGNSFVTLKVYDMLGKEVATLVNQYQTDGKYDVEFTATSQLASGMYIYKLTAGDFVSTKKLVLMK